MYRQKVQINLHNKTTDKRKLVDPGTANTGLLMK